MPRLRVSVAPTIEMLFQGKFSFISTDEVITVGGTDAGFIPIEPRPSTGLGFDLLVICRMNHV